ncbi:FAD dependent oxidoreductase [Calycina marina]|uniref:FAD dependent oxidoreductase n=1 Tax=Calycina marina TaxID=1763456 RepID=A0A9P7YX67_9HELO|nr:FAD dependent oxidoreductase [Calycina marina]
MPNIVVIGAGVSGLTSALLLSKNPGYKITIIAKHMPGDFDIEYTSPWAGANYMPVSDLPNSKYERDTWPELARLAKDVPEAGIHFQQCVIYNRNKDPIPYSGPLPSELFTTSPWFKDLFPDFKLLDRSELPPGVDSGTSFTSVCLNLAIYLPWLAGQCLTNGVIIKRAVLKHISEASSLHHSRKKADLIVNCSGLLASKLGGVMDTDVVPVRGITILVRNEAGAMYCSSGTEAGPDQSMYIMTRAAGGGTILGGTYQKGNWTPTVSDEEATAIMQRAVKLCPQLTNGKGIEALSVIHKRVGLRPLRQEGLRLVKERIGENWVVHNYGHAGWGYQASYGCSQRVKEIVDSISTSQAKL